MRCSVRRAFCGALLMVAGISVIEEINFGTVFISLMNIYTAEINFPISAVRNGSRVDIAVVVVVKGRNQQQQYVLAQASLRCYCQLHGYRLYVLDVTEEPSLADGCSQKDLMFQRHCVLANTMPNWPHEWVLFVDADMGVINPSHIIETYLPKEPAISLVFYQRIFNQEVMAGSYLVRNDEFSRTFLHSWADYEFRVPNSFHGTDNGALHSAIADLTPTEDLRHRELCFRYWNESRYYDSLSLHEVCLQLYLRKHPPMRVLVLNKGRLSWARDGWLTNSVWSPKDFFFHGWQLRRQDTLVFGRWHSPLVEHDFNLSKCSSPDEAYTNWRYKNTFVASDVAVDRLIMAKSEEAEAEFRKLQAKVEAELL